MKNNKWKALNHQKLFNDEYYKNNDIFKKDTFKLKDINKALDVGIEKQLMAIDEDLKAMKKAQADDIVLNKISNLMILVICAISVILIALQIIK